MSINVLVIGGTGMLGSMVVDVLRNVDGIKLFATARSTSFIKAVEALPDVSWRFFDALMVYRLDELFNGIDWVINCVGMTKPYTHDDDTGEVRRAVHNNVLFPHAIDEWIFKNGGPQVIQIATDCVYSGRDGNYDEESKHDATDVYGKTKSLGEVHSENFFNFRNSIIGPEAKNNDYLLTWFLGQEKGSECNGFTNHNWNGVTTYHFAQICKGIILNDPVDLPNMQHIVPTGTLSKADMLRQFAKCYDREDIKINDFEAKVIVDRTLSTMSPDTNEMLWKMAGYDTPPTVAEMIAECAECGYMIDLS